MKKILSVFAIFALIAGCQRQKNANVISERYIHKYGYDISKDEWESSRFPGQVMTTLRNGVCIVSSYEDGVLHGPTTYTYPYSKTIHTLQMFDKGRLVKKTTNDLSGIPQMDELYLTQDRVKVTRWYKSGTPLSVEEWENDKLVAAEYYSPLNQVEYRITEGRGVKLIRDAQQCPIAKETIEDGEIVFRESLHPNGCPYRLTPLCDGLLNGEVREYAPSGEPVLIEHWSLGEQEGLCTYFQNGCKYLERNYRQGQLHGIERRYVDGETLIEETEWLEGQRHGPSTVYYDGIATTQWFYNNVAVSAEKYKTLLLREQEIMSMHERSRSVSYE